MPETLCHEFHELHEFASITDCVCRWCGLMQKAARTAPPFRVIRVTRPKIFHFLETNLKMATAVHEHVHVNEIRARGR